MAILDNLSPTLTVHVHFGVGLLIYRNRGDGQMEDQKTPLEVIWGHRLLDEGFTSIPNIVVRNYRKLGIEHGEWGFICTLLTYKHDHRDPYPSQETIASHMQVSVRQIKKWSESLVSKNLLLVGQRRHVKNRQFGSAVYNFKPLIQAALALVGETQLPESTTDWDVEYRPGVSEVHPELRELEVHPESSPQVHLVPVPEVHPKRTKENTHIKINNNIVAVVRTEIEADLGQSIHSLMRLLPGWIQQHGENKLLELAQYMGDRSDMWQNIVGAYRTAVTELWEVQLQTAVSTRPEEHDGRYAEFYKLFPDT